VVASKDNSGVKFTDGSFAELANKLVVNCGEGEIQLIPADSFDDITTVNMFDGNGLFNGSLFGNGDFFDGNANDSEVKTAEFEFDKTSSLDVNILFNKCLIKRSPDEKTRVKARGQAKLIDRLIVDVSGNVLQIDFKQSNGSNTGHFKSNQIVVEVPYDKGVSADVKITGSGSLESEIRYFETGKFTINGSGDIQMHDFDTCKVTVNGSGSVIAKDADELNAAINGSGDTEWQNIKNAKLAVNGSGDVHLGTAHNINTAINGSGDIHINELTGGNAKISITGSGDYSINGGNCDKFDVSIFGSGEVDASELTAKTAHIILHQDGNVTLGRVLESSTEQIKQHGKITILNRGK